MFDATAPLPYVQPNEASFFREKACACPTTRVARLVRTRRKKDAAFGKYLHVGGAFFCQNLYSLSARADFVFSEYEYKATSQVNSEIISLAWQRSRRIQ